MCTSAEVNKIDFVDRIYNERRDCIMGPLRIRVLSLESKLTPHTRPAVDRKMEHLGTDPNLAVFSPSNFGLWSLCGGASICLSRGLSQKPSFSLPVPTNNANFVCSFEFERKRTLKRLDYGVSQGKID